MQTVQQIELGGEMGRRMCLAIENNLLALDMDADFIEPFRKRQQEEGFVGLGKQIDAVVHLAYFSRDPRLLALKRNLIGETIKTQQEDGYLGMFVPKSRMWRLWDLHEMSFLVLGLVSDYELFRESASLAGARKLVDYIIGRWVAEPDHPFAPEKAIHLSTLGFDEAILALYRVTGDARYREFCIDGRKLPKWDLEIVKGPFPPGAGHAYAYMARCKAQLDLYLMEADAVLLAQSRRALDFLTKHDGMAVSGTCSMSELWHDDQEGAGALGETCATAYLLFMLDSLMRVQPEPHYGDIMERSIFNSLYGAQSPDGRRLRYFTPFSGERVYFEQDTYCCPTNFRRIVGALPSMVYYGADNGIIVNLYTESFALLNVGQDMQVTIRQESTYPNCGSVLLRLDPSRSFTFPLILRIPGWADDIEVTVNGQRCDAPANDNRFLRIERKWHSGDAVGLRMPMPWRWIRGRKRQEGRAALMRGPLLFCVSRARNPIVGNADLGGITIDAHSTNGPMVDATVRPNGLACRVKAWRPGQLTSGDPDSDLVLTEFTDPDGEATYFDLSDEDLCREDELIRKQEDN